VRERSPAMERAGSQPVSNVVCLFGRWIQRKQSGPSGKLCGGPTYAELLREQLSQDDAAFTARRPLEAAGGVLER
jgi:hypothetical protein